MPADTIDQGLKISATYETVVFPELCTFGIHTGRRVIAEDSNLVTIMQAFLTDLETILVPVEGRTITISEWTTVGFTGWHQRDSFDDSANTYGSSNELPHQIQSVGSYVNDTESGVAVGRRRNRSYIGPCNSATINNADGRMGSTPLGDHILAWTNLDGALRTLGGAIAGADFDGLCVVSEAEGVVMEANRVKVGAKYDIHRSRAQKTPESYTVIAIP